MTRQRTHHSHALAVLALFVAVLTALVALATPDALASTPPLFLPAVTYSSGGITPVSEAVADVNHDGKLDLAIVNFCGGSVGDCTGSAGGAIGILLGNGDGTFQPVVTYGSGGFDAWSIAVGDMNGDGKPDLIVTNVCGFDVTCQSHSATIGVLLGNGDGTFQPVLVSDSGGFPGQSIAVADLNGDGKLDVVVGHCDVSGLCFTGSGNVAVLLGNGDGSFQPAVLYNSGGQNTISAVIADVNGDSKPDIVAANCGAANGGSDSCPEVEVVAVLLGDSDGTFHTAATYSWDGPAVRSLAVADVSGDGKPDLLVSAEYACRDCAEGGINVMLGNGDGTFQPALIYGSGGCDANSVAVSDVNGDGKPDVLIANVASVCGGGSPGAVGVLLGNGDGTFQTAVAYSAGGSGTGSVAIADLNGDGKPDVVVTNFDSNSVGVLLNNGAPLDTTRPAITLSSTPKVLWPANGRIVPVTISGTITDTGFGVNANSAAYSVKDEYGEVQPNGAITLGPEGNYSFTVLLQASRRGSDLDGRRYMITVRAKDNAGNGASKTSVVTVPHDQGH
jgi:hypothetical protein